jgi:hypothetical protein
MWSPTNREHEALEALVVMCVPWSEALEVGVDGARRSSAEEAPRLWGQFSVVASPLKCRPVRQATVSFLNVQTRSMTHTLALFEILQSEPSKMNQRF